MPAPNTTHVEPGSTLAVLIAAPSPVDRPQANSAARSAGASGETLASAISGITVYSAKVEVPMKWRIGCVVALQAGCPVREIALVLLLADRQAQVRLRALAVLALTALRGEQRDHAVAGRDAGDAVADLLDDARALVAEDRRCVSGRVGAGRRVQVGVADPARLEPHEHLTRLRLGELDVRDVERLTELLEHRGLDLQVVSSLRGSAEG